MDLLTKIKEDKMTKKQIKNIIYYFGGMTKCALELHTSTQALTVAMERGHFSLAQAIRIEILSEGYYQCENLVDKKYQKLLNQLKQIKKGLK